MTKPVHRRMKSVLHKPPGLRTIQSNQCGVQCGEEAGAICLGKSRRTSYLIPARAQICHDRASSDHGADRRSREGLTGWGENDRARFQATVGEKVGGIEAASDDDAGYERMYRHTQMLVADDRHRYADPPSDAIDFFLYRTSVGVDQDTARRNRRDFLLQMLFQLPRGQDVYPTPCRFGIYSHSYDAGYIVSRHERVKTHTTLEKQEAVAAHLSHCIRTWEKGRD